MGLETPMSVMTVGQHGSVQEDTWNVSSVIGLFDNAALSCATSNAKEQSPIVLLYTTTTGTK